MDPAPGTERPAVTVLMAVRDGAEFLREAVESILAQTLRGFEFLVVNDGSTDATREIVESYRDARITMLDNPGPMGLAASLNRGIDRASGGYIARMDCDDVSLPTRLERQAAFMDAHPDIAVCGTWVKTIGARDGDIWKFPAANAAIRSSLLFHSPLAHPSVMLRKRALDARALRYDPAYDKAQDYDLWVRCSPYLRFANIEETLLLYRLHARNMSTASTDPQYERAKAIRLAQLRDLGIEPAAEEVEIHESFATGRYRAEDGYLARADRWFEKLLAANAAARRYEEPEFSAMLRERWFAACMASTRLGLPVWAAYRRSDLMDGYRLPLRTKLRFLLKCLASH
jgi:glycosyltransferase involved in cell wall biosynthesis